MATARHDDDIFSPAAYLDGQNVAQNCKTLRAQGPVVWLEQSPYRPFWAVLSRDAIMDVERDSKTWLAAPRQALIPSDTEDAIIAQWGVRTNQAGRVAHPSIRFTMQG